MMITTRRGCFNKGYISVIGLMLIRPHPGRPLVTTAKGSPKAGKGAELNGKCQTLSLHLPPKRKENMSNRTFTMIKPDAFSKGHSGAIIDKILKSGFRIVALKLTRLSVEKAGEFYAVHKARPFYGELVDFISSGPIIAAILEKDNAVADFRKLIGATDPAKADEGTIRKLFAASVGENAIHGSDSDENAAIEGSFFFSGLEQI